MSWSFETDAGLSWSVILYAPGMCWSAHPCHAPSLHDLALGEAGDLFCIDLRGIQGAGRSVGCGENLCHCNW
jgi:hypothetical protein